jgi:hypothetical protein
MADGFSVDRAALAESAQGINDVVSALKGLGFDEAADVGRGFSELALSGLQVGNAGLQQAFGDFCGRWSWGVRSLVQDGNQFAARLGISAGLYADTENYLVGVAKDVTDAAVGDPHLSDGQVEQGSWSQAAAGVTGASTPEGNMSWQQADRNIEATWEAEGRDALTSGPPIIPGGPGIGELLGGSDGGGAG